MKKGPVEIKGKYWRRFHKRAVRRCLKCDKPFDSDGIGNRICKKCKKKWVDGELYQSVRYNN